MKKSKGNSSKIIIGVIGVLLVLAIGVGAGTLLGEKKAAKTSGTVSKDSKENDEKQVTTETKDNNTDSKKDPVSGSNEKDTNESPDGKSNSQSNQQVPEKVPTLGGTAVYDGSLPDDSPAIHKYEFILSDATWTTAYQDCLDRGGYLVRINSEMEYEYLRKEVVNQGMTNIFFRIGGKRDRNNQDYHWVNQEGVLFGEKLNSEYSWCSDAWGQGEPSFQDGNLEETYMDLFFSDAEKRFIWNDVPNDMLDAEPAYAGALGYICEYE